jgi:hypothetical protein
MVKKSVFSSVFPYIFGASMLVSTSLGAQDLKNKSINNMFMINNIYLTNFEKPFPHKSFETKINYDWRENIFKYSNQPSKDNLTMHSGDSITSSYFNLNHNLNLEQTAKELSNDIRIKIPIGNKRNFSITSSVVAPNYYPGIAFSIYKK